MAESPTLRRVLTLPVLTLYGLGNILGAGIYALVGKVAGEAGPLTPVAFLVAGLLAALTAVSYAELSARLPQSAAEAVYVEEAIGWRWLTLAVGLLIALSGIVSAAAMTNAFVGYLHVFVTVPAALVIGVVLGLMGLLAVWGISQSAGTAAVITLVEAGGLLLIVWVARSSFGELPAQLPSMVPDLKPAAWTPVLLGAFLAFYAFIGFEDVVNVAEEVQSPQRTLPLAIFGALVVALVLYLAVAVAALGQVSASELGASDAPLALVYERATGDEPRVITLISLVAVINGALIQIVMASRVIYGLADKGWIPKALARVSPRTRTPVMATLGVTALTIGFALWLPLAALAGITSLLLLLVFATVNLSLVFLKRREPRPDGVRTYPLVIPLLGVASCLGLVAFQSIQTLGG